MRTSAIGRVPIRNLPKKGRKKTCEKDFRVYIKATVFLTLPVNELSRYSIIESISSTSKSDI